MRCCVLIKDIKRTINLLDTQKYNNRIIKIYQCPVCDRIKPILQQYNFIKQVYEYETPKAKKVAEWLRAYESEPYLENIKEFKQGTKSNMGWYYGKGRSIYNFNDELVGTR